uniref:Cysteine rich secretory protein 2 n=1 Tax=Callorhinchus milii TaxID=7868 RepID=A0A4W3IQV5_CALMI
NKTIINWSLETTTVCGTQLCPTACCISPTNIQSIHFTVYSVKRLEMSRRGEKPNTFKALCTSDTVIQRIIVNTHNKLRRQVEPSASNMLKMVWNKNAAKNAQKWAETCSMEHSTDQNSTIPRFLCGENLYMSSCPTPWPRVVQAWYNEVKDFKYGVGKLSDRIITHYTQVAWYNSYQIGCAIAHCPNKELHYFYVCQYCPAGNIMHLINTPYKAGPSCSDCPNACENKLCTNTCSYMDRFSNCDKLKQMNDCGPFLNYMCPASCFCVNKII